MFKLSREIAIWMMITIMIVIAGCSGGGGSPLLPDAPDNHPPGDNPPQDDPPVDDPQPGQLPEGRQLLGMWDLTFDRVTFITSVDPVQGVETMFSGINTDVLEKFLSSLNVKVNFFDNVHNVAGLDVTLKNPMQNTAFDVRGVFHAAGSGPQLRNPEGWTRMFDTPGGLEMKPYRKFGDDGAVIGPSEEVTEHFVVKYYSTGGKYTCTLSVDGTWFDEKDDQVFEISKFRSTGFYNSGGSGGEVLVDINDPDGIINKVILNAASITGDASTEMKRISPATWKVEIENSMNATPGLYQVIISAYAIGLDDIQLHGYFNVEVRNNEGWGRTWGGVSGSTDPEEYGDRARGCMTDHKGNIYVTGMYRDTVDFDPGVGVMERTSNGDFDIYLSKFSPTGMLLWVNTWGGPDLDFGDSLATDNSGNVYLTGRFLGTLDFDPGPGYEYRTAENKDAYLCKFNADGELEWVNAWGGPGHEYGFGVCTDNYGNVYVTGNFEETADFDPGAGECLLEANDADVYLVKFDGSGDFLWAKSWGGDDWDFGTDVKVDSYGYVFVTGCFGDTVDFEPGYYTTNRTSGGFWDAFIVKYSSSGSFYWVETWGGKGWDFANALAISSFNDVYITGDFQYEVDFDPDNWNDAVIDVGWRLSTYISSFDRYGNFEWVRNLAGAEINLIDNTPDWNDPGLGIDADSYGDVYITGWYEGTAQFPAPWNQAMPSNGGRDAFIAKFTRGGDCEWAYNFGGPGRDEGYGLTVDPWNNIFVSGFYEQTVDFCPGFGVVEYTSEGYDDAFLVKYLPNGTW